MIHLSQVAPVLLLLVAAHVHLVQLQVQTLQAQLGLLLHLYFVLQLGELLAVAYFLLLDPQEGNKKESDAEPDNKEEAERDQRRLLDPKNGEREVGSDDSAGHENHEHHDLEDPWHVDFPDSVDFFQVRNDLRLRLLRHEVEVEADFPSFLTQV